MKTQPQETHSLARRVVGLSFVLCTLFAVASVFGQTAYVWTNQNGGVITVNTNWSPNGLPNGNNGSGYANNDPSLWDSAQFDGRTTGTVVITNTTGTLPNTGFNTFGINIVVTANQTNDVQFISNVGGGSSGQIGLNFVTNNSPHASLIMGDTNAPTSLMRLTGRPAGATHYWYNGSTAPLIINPSAEWQAGGGTAYTFDFSGPGNFNIWNNLRNDNGSGGSSVVVEGPGTVTWTNGTKHSANDPLNGVTVNGGTLIFDRNLLTAGLSGNGGLTNIGGLLVFRTSSPSDADTISRRIEGFDPAVFEVRQGTLTLTASNSTYNGKILLTGGELIVAGVEHPEAPSGPLGYFGSISFKGGTLGFSVNNVYDYSSRFETNGQSYSIDTGGQNVTFTNAAGLSGAGNTLTKVGSGTLTLAAPSTYTGLTTISVGQLLFQGTKTGNGNITVADGAALGVTDTGTQITPGTLTLGTSGGAILEFNNVNNTTTAPLAATTLASAGTVTVNVNSGPLVPGQSYPLLSWTSGSAPAVSLGILNGFIGNLTTNGTKIQLNVTATAYKWTGLNNNSWDLNTPNNWLQNGGAVTFANGGPALLDDSSSRTNVTIGALVQPTLLTVNSTNPYSIASSGANNLGGSGSLIKAGSGSLTLSGGANTYTGKTTISGGTLSVGALANGGSASDIGAASSAATNLVLNGGTLQYTGSGANIDRLFTLGTSGGTIDASGSGALAFSTAGPLGYNGNGPRGLTLTGADTNNSSSLAGNIVDNGGPTTLTKNGAGTWILTGTNAYSGATTIANGVLQVGAGSTNGTLGTGNVVDNASLDVNRSGTLTINGAITGTGNLTNDGTGTVILANDNTYSGGTTINAGTLQVGNGGATGKLSGNSQIRNNGILIFNSTGDFTMSASISGSGQLIKRGSGLLVLRGGGANYSYNGGTTIDQGARLQIFSGNEATFSGQGQITNNGSLILVRQDNNAGFITNNIVGSGSVTKENNNDNQGDVTLLGTNTYTGGTFIRAATLILGNNLTPNSGTIAGNVTFGNSSVTTLTARQLVFNRPDNFTFSGNIIGAVTNVGGGAGQVAANNAGRVIQNGFGVLTLTGNNTYPAGTDISNGVVQVGNGGTSGSIGTGRVNNSGTLVWNRSDDTTFGGVISDGAIAGNFVKMGSGVLTLTASNTYSGQTTVSNGTLIVTNIQGDLYLEGGTVAPAPIGTVGTLAFQGFNLFMDSGAVGITVNKSLAQSNSVIVLSNNVTAVVGAITANGGTIKVFNAGPALQPGDKFYIFSKKVEGGNPAAITITGGGATWNNNLGTDGSISVATVVPANPPAIGVTTPTTNSIQLSWTNNANGNFLLQAQTNRLNVGISTNWGNYPGGSTSPVTVPIALTNGAVFFRLVPTF